MSVFLYRRHRVYCQPEREMVRTSILPRDRGNTQLVRSRRAEFLSPRRGEFVASYRGRRWPMMNHLAVGVEQMIIATMRWRETQPVRQIIQLARRDFGSFPEEIRMAVLRGCLNATIHHSGSAEQTMSPLRSGSVVATNEFGRNAATTQTEGGARDIETTTVEGMDLEHWEEMLRVDLADNSG